MKNKRHVYEFLISPTEKVCVELSDNLGGFNLSINIRFPLDKLCDYWEPTTNRLMIGVEHIPELIKALDKAYRIYRANLNARTKEGNRKAS